MCAVLKVEPGTAVWEALIRTLTLDQRLSAPMSEAYSVCVDQGYGHGLRLVHQTRPLIPDKALRLPRVRELNEDSGPPPTADQKVQLGSE